MDHFKQISGLGMNNNKSTIFRPGSIAHSGFKVGRMSIGKKCLGIDLSAVTGEISDLNYPERMKKIMCLSLWNFRGLPTVGRILIVKSVAVSRLIYVMCMVLILSSYCMDKIKDILHKVTWNKKRDRIKRKMVN